MKRFTCGETTYVYLGEDMESYKKAQKLADERLLLRKNKEFVKADELRRKINTLGWEIIDITL